MLTRIQHVAIVSENFVRETRFYEVVLGIQLLVLAAAAAGIALARYYVLVTWATVVSLFNYLRAGVPPVWEKAEGTR